MANSKISALTSATTVAGTEVLPIVQSSATVKVSVANLTPGLSTITAAKGGTGQTSYAVGDLLYADTTTTLAKLADVATGNALISGGIGVLPSYGKIGLTTHVSGTLPIANGGTNATSFTANQILYGSFSQSAGLTFDGTNFATTGTATAAKLIPTGTSVTGNGLYLPAANALGLSTNGTNAVYIDSSQNVGIGTTSPSTYGKFVVTGSSSSGVATFIGNASLTGSAPTYQGAIRLIDNPTSSTTASGGIEFLTATFGSGYGWKMASIDSSGVQLTFATRQNSASWTEIARFNSSNNFSLIGNVVQSTAAKGFDFSANTPAAGMTSQLLNWYEEGSWTPNQGAGLTLVGAFSSTGKYTRIGRQVSISGTVTGATSVAVTAAGVITSNLPFTVVTAGHGDATNVAINASATVICTSTNVTAAAAIAATATITFSATYFV
jgi:hypothetical protein